MQRNPSWPRARHRPPARPSGFRTRSPGPHCCSGRRWPFLRGVCMGTRPCAHESQPSPSGTSFSIHSTHGRCPLETRDDAGVPQDGRRPHARVPAQTGAPGTLGVRRAAFPRAHDHVHQWSRLARSPALRLREVLSRVSAAVTDAPVLTPLSSYHFSVNSRKGNWGDGDGVCTVRACARTQTRLPGGLRQVHWSHFCIRPCLCSRVPEPLTAAPAPADAHEEALPSRSWWASRHRWPRARAAAVAALHPPGPGRRSAPVGPHDICKPGTSGARLTKVGGRGGRPVPAAGVSGAGGRPASGRPRAQEAARGQAGPPRPGQPGLPGPSADPLHAV